MLSLFSFFHDFLRVIKSKELRYRSHVIIPCCIVHREGNEIVKSSYFSKSGFVFLRATRVQLGAARSCVIDIELTAKIPVSGNETSIPPVSLKHINPVPIHPHE